jgi:hypothetical protein
MANKRASDVPRVCVPLDGAAEVPLQTHEHLADRDPLQRVVLERRLAGVQIRARISLDTYTPEVQLIDPQGELPGARRSRS